MVGSTIANPSILAQAGHGCSKLIWNQRTNDRVLEYMKDPNHMTKVVLSVKNQSQLSLLEEELKAGSLQFETWTEQPENQKICLVTVPYEPEEIRPLLKRCSLY